ncbi:MAG: hypothetical protein RSE91_00640, partial [Bacilli bacterium]
IRAIIISSIAFTGIASIACGSYALTKTPNNNEQKDTSINDLNVFNQNQELSLREITIKVGDPLSTTISDYLNTTLTKEKLELISINTKSVDNEKAGTYPYHITYNGKTYTSNIIVTPKKEETKKEEQHDNIVLTTKNITLTIGETLSYDISNYVNEVLDDNLKKQLKLDLSAIVKNKVGTYTYKISYYDQIFNGTVKVIEEKKVEAPPVVTPPKVEEPKKEDPKKEEPKKQEVLPK